MLRMVNYIKKALSITDNYLVAKIQNRPSTSQFWYLPEPPAILDFKDFEQYKKCKLSPFYLMDYRAKLKFTLTNPEGIILLPYPKPIGKQINPEAAFQFALGLHDEFYYTKNNIYKDQFFHYADYFLKKQTSLGLWDYEFDWFTAKAPWHSALAQSRGAAVMLRAWLLSKKPEYYHAAIKSLNQFLVPTDEGGFLHEFKSESCWYFEEYPPMPTGVINGFMASLISIWELSYWTKETSIKKLWKIGIESLQKMLPYYSMTWWSLYDLDEMTPIKNVNSPRYHLLEINYLKILNFLEPSSWLKCFYEKRLKQYHNKWFYFKALNQKMVRKIIYK